MPLHETLGAYVQYVYALLILIGSVVAAKILLWFTNRYVKKITAKTKTKLDDLILEKIQMPVYYLFIIIGLSLALAPLNFSEGAETIIRKIMFSIMILFVSFIIVRTIGIFITHWVKKKIEKTKSSLDDELLPIISKTVKGVIYILALLYILRVWGGEITPLLAGLGIAGLAIGLALKDTLENVFAGISILADRYFIVGDVIKLESGDTGRVIDLGLRSTKIMTFDNEVIIVPNSQIAGGRLINYAKPEIKARISLEIGVAYGSNPDKVKKVILEVVKKLAVKEKHIITKDPEPAIYFTEMGDFALKFALKVWVNDYRKRYTTKDKLNTGIYNALKKARIEIPFPTRTVYMKKG